MRDLLKTKLDPQCLKLIQGIAAFQQAWCVAADTTQTLYAGLKTTTIITSAGSSTRIEGATLSDEEIQHRLDGLTIKHIRDRDEAEVAGYIDGKKYIFESYRDLPISEHTIRSLHQIMMGYLAEDIFPFAQRGSYKNVANSVVRIEHATGTQEIIFETTPPGPQTEAAMRALTADYAAFIHDPTFSDLEVIAAFIVKFLAIHPFRDGNGRISRLLTDLCLLTKGYEFCMYASHEKVIEDSKAQYYVALRQTQAGLGRQPDLNPWFLFFLKVLDQQTRVVRPYLASKKLGTLTQKAAIVFDMIQKHGTTTIGFLERETGMKRVTLKAILTRLKNQGHIVMEGEKKTSRYRVKT